MAWSSACGTFPQNLSLGGKDKFAGAAPIEDKTILTISLALIPAIAPPIISALFSIIQYSKDDFLQIFKTVLDSRPPTLPPTPTWALQQYKNPYERPFKAWFLDIY